MRASLHSFSHHIALTGCVNNWESLKTWKRFSLQWHHVLTTAHAPHIALLEFPTNICSTCENWKVCQHFQCQVSLNTAALSEDPPGTTAVYGLQSSTRPKILSEIQKYRKSSEALQQLASRIGEQLMSRFEISMTAVKQFITASENGSAVVVPEYLEQDASKSVPATCTQHDTTRLLNLLHLRVSHWQVPSSSHERFHTVIHVPIFLQLCLKALFCPQE